MTNIKFTDSPSSRAGGPLKTRYPGWSICPRVYSVNQALASVTHGLRLYFMPVPLLEASRAPWGSSVQTPMENPVKQKKVERKWLLLGAVIYGITLLNGLRFIHTLPSWAVALGTAVNLFMFLGFLKIYQSSGRNGQRPGNSR